MKRYYLEQHKDYEILKKYLNNEVLDGAENDIKRHKNNSYEFDYLGKGYPYCDFITWWDGSMSTRGLLEYWALNWNEMTADELEDLDDLNFEEFLQYLDNNLDKRRNLP